MVDMPGAPVFRARVQAASGFSFNPNAFITFSTALKLGFPSLERVL